MCVIKTKWNKKNKKLVLITIVFVTSLKNCVVKIMYFRDNVNTIELSCGSKSSWPNHHVYLLVWYLSIHSSLLFLSLFLYGIKPDLACITILLLYPFSNICSFFFFLLSFFFSQKNKIHSNGIPSFFFLCCCRQFFFLWERIVNSERSDEMI